jgi:hypothetical protein
MLSDDDEARALIVSANLQRRNLTKGQQAMALAQLSQQRVGVLKSLPGLLQDYYGPDEGGGAPASTIPGTIGTGQAATAPVDTGRGPLGITIPPGTPTATFDQSGQGRKTSTTWRWPPHP